jgi:peptide/nickel transport system substrate-binding protein
MNTRTPWLAISLMVICSMLLSACGTSAIPAAPAASASGASAPAAETASDASKAYLTINFEQVSTWVRNFNPFSANKLGSVNTAIYEPMMIYNKSTGELVPWLATAFTWSDDNLTLTFTLRPNVKFSDGQPLTSKDVVYTFDLIKNNTALTGFASSVLADYIDSFTAPDDATVVFKFKTVHTPALYDIANQTIVPEHIWKDVKDPLTWTNDNPVATGPFTQVAKFENQIYVLEKNPYYWQEGKPAFQGLRYPAYPDNDAANLALVNGELDWTGNFVPDIENTFVAKNKETNHYFIVGGDGIALMINTSIKPFDDPAVRKALSMGVDRDMVVKTAMYNYIPAADATGLGQTYKVWKDQAAIDAGADYMKFDTAKANKALDDAGLKKGSDGIRLDKDGKPMVYDFIVPSGWTDWISAAQIICQNMKDLGITLNLSTPEETTWTDSVTKGDFKWSIVYSSGGPTPYNFYRGQMSSVTSRPVGENASENWGRYVSKDADKLLDEFAVTSDPARQKEIMNKLEMVFVNEAPVIPLFPGPDWYEFSTARFTGFPDKDNNYAPGIPYADNPYNATLIILTTIKPK